MIDSLREYKELTELTNSYDNSGLFEILESVYIQLCQSDPWFNAYTDYKYLNAVKEHELVISKLLDLSGSTHLFSQLFLYSRGDEIPIICIDRIDYNQKGREERKVYETYVFDSNTFTNVYNSLKTWFDENLINVKKFKNKEND